MDKLTNVNMDQPKDAESEIKMGKVVFLDQIRKLRDEVEQKLTNRKECHSRRQEIIEKLHEILTCTTELIIMSHDRS